jgi:cytochrome P450
VLVFGAQDTTSAALSRLLWQLSIRQDIQANVRQEIQELQLQRGVDRLGYEDLMSLTWLDAVIKETLRVYVNPLVRRDIH